MLNIGDKAPDFSLESDSMGRISLKDFLGKKVILYFYPKDDTPGCTKEACSLRDNFSQLQAKNSVVIGVSPDNSQSHVKFREKYHLPFILVSDPEKEVLNAYDAWGKKNSYGKITVSVKRSTYIIDEDGIIIKIIKKVKTESHGFDVQEFL